MNRLTFSLAVIILLLGAILGSAASLISAAEQRNAWPTVCAQAADGVSTCIYATATPRPTWEAATVEAVATWQAARQTTPVP